MKSPARIILLNGPGSVGKTSVAQALQKITETPFLHVRGEDFLNMLPATHRDHPEGTYYETLTEGGRPSAVLRTGRHAQAVMSGMRHAVAAMAREGNNLIVDDALNEGGADAYVRLLASCRLYIVGLYAPLDVLEARESRRSDRRPGLARWQFERVHRGVNYDIGIDTATDSPEACATTLKLALKL